MAMNFWEEQKKARSSTWIYIALFILLTAGIAFTVEWAIRSFDPEDYSPDFPMLGFFFVLITLTVASFNYYMYRFYGGTYVAESVGGNLVSPQTKNPKEIQLLNIVEEMSIAASIPMPKVYILPVDQINAFAAGMTKDKMVIAISEGSLNRLTRDEVQGVIAHEVGHIYNADMKISMMLSAMIAGFFVIMYLGLRILQFSPMRRRDDKGGPPVALIAIVFIAAGIISWFAGKILAACVSRQREYLADACSVQFTRNPSGILGALLKIKGDSVKDMPVQGMSLEQLYFNSPSFFSSLFATHPDLDKRIAAIRAGTYAFDPKDQASQSKI